MSLYIDLTEFLATFRTTGIERIDGELCRCLPAGAATPVQFRGGRYHALAPAVISILGKYFEAGGKPSTSELERLARSESPLEIASDDTLLVPEIFGEERAEFFRALPKQALTRCRFIIYDLLPFTHPEFFLPGLDRLPLVLSGYFQIVRDAEYCGFISEYTRDTYYSRLKRTDVRGGVVLRLGCNALGPRPKRAILNRPLTFTVLGTVEPRKNHMLILDAFEPLLRHIKGLSLLFIGRMGWVDSTFSDRVRALASNPDSGFQFHAVLTDTAVRQFVEQSRATIYVSAAEGYGLPPVESLWLGTPVIASKTVPSARSMDSAGIHYVEPLDVPNLRRAVMALLNDDYANHKAEEALGLNLSTWQSFTEEVLRWCAERRS